MHPTVAGVLFTACKSQTLTCLHIVVHTNCPVSCATFTYLKHSVHYNTCRPHSQPYHTPCCATAPTLPVKCVQANKLVLKMFSPCDRHNIRLHDHPDDEPFSAIQRYSVKGFKHRCCLCVWLWVRRSCALYLRDPHHHWCLISYTMHAHPNSYLLRPVQSPLWPYYFATFAHLKWLERHRNSNPHGHPVYANRCRIERCPTMNVALKNWVFKLYKVFGHCINSDNDPYYAMRREVRIHNSWYLQPAWWIFKSSVFRSFYSFSVMIPAAKYF